MLDANYYRDAQTLEKRVRLQGKCQLAELPSAGVSWETDDNGFVVKASSKVFDLRFCVPNKEVMPEKGIHTLEHLFAGFMRNHLNGNGVEIIDISPMGWRIDIVAFGATYPPHLRQHNGNGF